MQLRLTADEIRLLFEILQAGAGNLCERLCGANEGEISPALQCAQVARSVDFDSDELDYIMDLVRNVNLRLRKQVAAENDPRMKRALQLKQAGLRCLSDKISEACAML